MEESFLGFLVTSIAVLIVTLIIMYHIIKNAVQAGTSQLTKSNMTLVKLKEIELMKSGLNIEQITSMVNRLHKSEQLKFYRSKMWISQAEYEQQKAELAPQEKATL